MINRYYILPILGFLQNKTTGNNSTCSQPETRDSKLKTCCSLPFALCSLLFALCPPPIPPSLRFGGQARLAQSGRHPIILFPQSKFQLKAYLYTHIIFI
jgi:hypothetical protein